MGAASTPHAATFSSRFAEYFKPPTSPAEYLARSLKQSSISLTLGVFIGAALTTGVAFGALTAWLANEKVLRRLVKHAGVVVHHARDAVLNTREGRALARALLAAPGAPTNPSDDVGGSAPQDTSPAVGLPSPATSRFDSGMGLAALRDDEILPPVYPTGGHYLPYQLGPGNTCYLSGYISRAPDGTIITGTHVDAELLSKLPPELNGVLSSAQGAEAARTCALGHLAILSDCCGGFANVRRFVKVHCFVNVNPTPAMCAAAAAGGLDAGMQWFRESPTVANGYTDLMKQVMGEAGAHARSAICISGLPFGAAVEIEAIVELIDASLVTPCTVEFP